MQNRGHHLGAVPLDVFPKIRLDAAMLRDLLLDGLDSIVRRRHDHCQGSDHVIAVRLNDLLHAFAVYRVHDVVDELVVDAPASL
jgi:hypothetical protein